jgi:hypothetical protein
VPGDLPDAGSPQAWFIAQSPRRLLTSQQASAKTEYPLRARLPMTSGPTSQVPISGQPMGDNRIASVR